MENSPPPIKEVFGVFCDQITQESVRRIALSIAFATQNGFERIHLLFQSTGGFVSEGIVLYNLFKTLPIELVIYNAGGVNSIASIAFLGAKKRVTSARAVFMIHKTTVSPQFASSHVLKSAADGAVIDDKRTESILRDHLKLTDEDWNALNHNNLYFTGEEAIKLGFADEIGEFAPPKGQMLYSV